MQLQNITDVNLPDKKIICFTKKTWVQSEIFMQVKVFF